MKRRDFINMAGLSAGAMMLPFTGFGREVDPAELLTFHLRYIASKKVVGRCCTETRLNRLAQAIPMYALAVT
jgi:hypothetical protein